jgi:SpoVK/Ycf46/Vps4 family AAA+-type ATPase
MESVLSRILIWIAYVVLKSLIKSYTEGDDSRFYATAMQIAAGEARKGHNSLAEELKELINKAKSSQEHQGKQRRLPISSTQKDLNDLLELVHPDVKLKDMVLAPEVRSSLKRILDEQKKTEILKQHKLFPRKKILLTGPPGCGKTMTANAIAKELGISLFIIRLDGLISRYMGESIAKLRLIFDAMHEFRAVYLFDEFDSIGTTRNQGNEVGEIKRVLNSFLLQIEKEDSPSLIIAATNLPKNLDEALFRRFDDIISFPLPSVNEIRDFYELLLSDALKRDSFSLENLSENSLGLSYADIKRVSEELLKHNLIYGANTNPEEYLLEAIKLRKKLF